MTDIVAWVRRRQTAISVAILAALAYLPALTAAPGRMPTDSKLYVYLDPGRFIGDTTTTFDARQFAGWVPHQHIAYLWPTGPWYWMFETLGFPDWIAHRLWIGTLLLVAGLGVRWMTKVLGFAPLAALVAALVYQLSPYILPYISRTSVLLLPFAGLGWIVGCTILAGQRGRWRYPALIALIVLTVGAVNATALAMVIPAPVLWLVHATWNRSITWRRALATTGRVALLSTGVSLWWMVMLIIQGRYGADVLAYSESLESVSFTSTSTEVTRGLGYWLFYVRDAFAATTTASIDHLVSLRVVLAGFVLLAICLAGVVFTESPHRRFAGLLVGAGVILGVGVHPIDNPSPFMDLLVGDGETGLALALRSSTRAVPVLLLGLAIGAASLITVAGSLTRLLPDVERRQRRWLLRVGAAAVVGLLAVVNLPALRTGGFVDPALERDQTPPDHWLAAAADLDDRPDGYRVLQVPGTEFGAFEWGFTVDQPLPGLTERPLVTRDLLPLGSPAAMDLAFALDDRLQEGTLDVASVAPIARLLGVDTVWVSGDIGFDRFGLARPEVVTDLLTSADASSGGLSSSTDYGSPRPAVGTIPSLDAEALGDERIGQPIAPISLVDVDDPVPTVRVKDDVVLVFGSGDGLIDAAAAGLIDGTEAVIYAASDVEGVVPSRAILTDSNRDRAHHWRSSQDVHGYTESAEPESGVLRYEAADQRLPVFGEDETAPGAQTVSVQRGPVTAQASAYGEPFAYRPEHRPVMAIDGDFSTAWLVADRSPAEGEFIELSFEEPVAYVDLRQPDLVAGTRTIAEVAVRVDGADVARVPLDDRSFVGTGQRIELAEDLFVRPNGQHAITVEITATNTPDPAIAEAIGPVGFVEIGVGLEPTVEWIRVPTVDIDAAVPLDAVFARLRTEPTDPWRSDPEPAMRRVFELGRNVTVGSDAEFDVTLRFDQRSGGAILASVLGESVVDSAHLTGAPTRRGATAFDGNPTTAWVTPFDSAVGSSVTFAGAGVADSLQVDQLTGTFSAVTRLRIDDGAGAFDVDVAGAEIALPRPIDLTTLTIEIIDTDEQVTVDRRYAEPFSLPTAISEIRFDGVSPTVVPVDRVAAECRDDLLSVNGVAVGLSFEASVSELMSAAPISASVCGEVVFGAGEQEISSTPGALTGFHVDRVTLRTNAGIVDASLDPTATVLLDSTRRTRTIEVPACPIGCWVIVGEGFNEAWSASADGRDLGAPTLVDGNANGWWLDPTQTTTLVEVEWTAQRPLNFAFLLSALFALVCIGLVVWDRRRDGDQLIETPSVAVAGLPRTGLEPSVLIGGAAALVGGALFVGWPWGVLAGVIWTACTVVRRVRLVGWIGWLIVVGGGLAVTSVVRSERPFPNAGWPIRFEWLHGWTLLGIVLITAAALVPDRDER